MVRWRSPGLGTRLSCAAAVLCVGCNTLLGVDEDYEVGPLPMAGAGGTATGQGGNATTTSSSTSTTTTSGSGAGSTGGGGAGGSGDAQVVAAGPGLALAVPDTGGYNGSVESMACVPLEIPDAGTTEVTGVEVRLGMDHPWVGDLVIKLLSPSGRVLTLMSRPGLYELVDYNYEPNGDGSDLSASAPIRFAQNAPNEAESMGGPIGDDEVVCADDQRCDYYPSPGAGPGDSMSDFDGDVPSGEWRLCVGDGDDGDQGIVDFVELSVSST